MFVKRWWILAAVFYAPVWCLDEEKRGSWARRNDREYYVEVHRNGDLESATATCRNMSAQLMVVEDSEEWEFVRGTIPFLTPYGKPFAFHLGLERTGSGLFDFQWSDGTSFDNSSAWWSSGEPDNKGGVEKFVVAGDSEVYTGDLKWRDVPHIVAKFICERKVTEPFIPAVNGSSGRIANETIVVPKTTLATSRMSVSQSAIVDRVGTPKVGLNPSPTAIAPRSSSVAILAGLSNDASEGGKLRNAGEAEKSVEQKNHLPGILERTLSPEGAPFSMLSLVGIVAVGAIAIATIVFVISYFMEKRNAHFV